MAGQGQAAQVLQQPHVLVLSQLNIHVSLPTV